MGMTMKKDFRKTLNFFSIFAEKNLDMGIYSDRLMLQKIVYILQEAGINFEYYFNWYVKGPYSTRLAAESFEFFEENKHYKTAKLNSHEEKIAMTIKKQLGEFMKTEKEIEILGSLVFIIRQLKIKEKDKIIEKLISLKPWYEKQEIEMILDKIEKSLFFN